MNPSMRAHLRKRAKATLFLCVLLGLWCTQCVVGGEGAPCKANTDCGGSNICVGGVCLNAGADVVPGEKPVDARQEPADDDAAAPPDIRLGEPQSGDESGTIDAGEPVVDAKSEPPPDTGEVIPEEIPEPINYGPQQRIGLSSGGGRMSSPGYKLYGSVSAGLLGAPHEMSSPGYKLKAGLLSGTQP